MSTEAAQDSAAASPAPDPMAAWAQALEEQKQQADPGAADRAGKDSGAADQGADSGAADSGGASDSGNAQAKTADRGGDAQQGGPLADDMRPVSGSAAGASSSGGAGTETMVNDIKMVLDIPVQLSVELGRTRVPIKYILQLAQGSVVELDALAGEPMDVLVNGYLIAQGEVVVVNDKFGIRLTDVVTPSERLRRVSRG